MGRPKAKWDSGEFRRCLGRFPTGVTVVTSVCSDGRPIGLTANSFSSVSLDPPMVLWSLAKTSSNATHFRDAQHFSIHVLAERQRPLAMRFAAKVEDRFEGLEVMETNYGTPALEGCAVRFDCRTINVVDGGDHHIFIGEVIELAGADEPTDPLVFHQGSFAAIASPIPTAPAN